MTLSVISDWSFTPKFMGNDEMVIHLHQLNGIDELKLGIGEKRDPIAFLEEIVRKIENPIKLDFGKGTPRNLRIKDIAEIGALKDLYFEILVEYGSHTQLSEEVSKN